MNMWRYLSSSTRCRHSYNNSNNEKPFYGTFPGIPTQSQQPSSKTLKACSHCRHEQDKTVLFCPCQRCEQPIRDQVFIMMQLQQWASLLLQKKTLCTKN